MAQGLVIFGVAGPGAWGGGVFARWRCGHTSAASRCGGGRGRCRLLGVDGLHVAAWLGVERAVGRVGRVTW